VMKHPVAVRWRGDRGGAECETGEEDSEAHEVANPLNLAVMCSGAARAGLMRVSHYCDFR
jgi:hypothetical protein